MISYLVVSSGDAIDFGTLDQIKAGLEKWIPEDFEISKTVISKSRSTVIIIWEHKRSEVKSYFNDKKDCFSFLLGYVTDFSPFDVESFEACLCRDGNYADFKNSPGGVYSLVSVDLNSDQVSIIQSASGVVPAYISEKNGFLTVSDRAIVSHLACNQISNREPSSPVFDLSFVPTIVQANFLFDDTTPYSGTRRINKNSALVVHKARHDTYKRQINNRIPETRNIFDMISQFEKILVESCSVFKWAGKPTLRISGGKDSRLLAALFANCGVDFSLENHNLPTHSEGALVDIISEILGLPVSRNLSEKIYPQDQFQESLVRRGGMLNPVPLHYNYSLKPSETGRPLVLGHAHHPRGGFARSMGRPQVGYKEYILEKFQLPTVRPMHFKKSDEFFNDYFQGRKVNHLLHYAYWAYGDLRVPGYLSNHYTDYSSHSFQVYPFLDEKVILFFDECISSPEGFFNIVSEKVFFGVLLNNNQKLANLPLLDKRWRFEVDGPCSEFEDGYESRSLPFKETFFSKNDVPDPFYDQIEYEQNQLQFDIFDNAKSYILDSKERQFLLSILSDEFHSYLNGHAAQISTMSKKASEESLMCVFGCAALLNQ